jgi:hypothetical protein
MEVDVMRVKDIKKNMIVGSVIVSTIAAFMATVLFLRRNKAATAVTRNSIMSGDGSNLSDVQDTGSAAESYITALSRLLEEAGISDDREQDTRYLQSSSKTGSERIELRRKDKSIDKMNRGKREKRENMENMENELDIKIDGDSREEIAEILNEMQVKSNEDLLTNEGMAKVVLQLVGLKNLIDPAKKVDIQNIHFMNDGKHSSMVIELFTSTYGAPAYDNELLRLWREAFPAEDFWNTDFTKVRVNVKDADTGNAIETVSCSADDVQRYLRDEISEERFVSLCKHKRARNRKDRVS